MFLTRIVTHEGAFPIHAWSDVEARLAPPTRMTVVMQNDDGAAAYVLCDPTHGYHAVFEEGLLQLELHGAPTTGSVVEAWDGQDASRFPAESFVPPDPAMSALERLVVSRDLSAHNGLSWTANYAVERLRAVREARRDREGGTGLDQGPEGGGPTTQNELKDGDPST